MLDSEALLVPITRLPTLLLYLYKLLTHRIEYDFIMNNNLNVFSKTLLKPFTICTFRAGSRLRIEELHL